MQNKLFIQKAFKEAKKKGTLGSFTRWCKRHGYPKVTTDCIELAKKSKSLKTRKRAIFAENIRPKHRLGNLGELKYLKSF